MARTGYFVIADITGYTAFLTRSELDHAQGILEDLFESLLQQIKPPLLVSNVQGDAILAYAPTADVKQGQIILEMVENLYCAFAAAREQVERNTTCPCKACRNTPDLDLKLVVHHGEFVVQKIAGREELGGPDVILSHRLLKNRVTEATGIGTYALFTGAAVEAIGMAEFFADKPQHVEQVEQLGEVATFVYPLAQVWERRRNAYRIHVGPGDPLWFAPIEADLPVPPSRVWVYLTDPDYRKRWTPGLDRITVTGFNKGRMGTGTTLHCAHGKHIFVLHIVDWRPFDYVTFEIPLPLNGYGRQTFELTPIEGGTHLALRNAKAFAPNALRTVAVRLLTAPMKRWIADMSRREIAAISEIAHAEAAAAISEPIGPVAVAAPDIAAAARARLNPA